MRPYNRLMHTLRRAAAWSRILGVGGRGVMGLWLTLLTLGLLRRLGSAQKERVVRRRLRPGQSLLVRVVPPGTEPPAGRRLG